jgi:hypothetical protein
MNKIVIRHPQAGNDPGESATQCETLEHLGYLPYHDLLNKHPLRLRQKRFSIGEVISVQQFPGGT